MNDEFKIIILAIFDENDFPNKALVEIHGRPMIQYAYDSAVESGASEVVVATDSPRVGMAAEEFGASVCMIADESLSGVSRLAEVADKMAWGDDTIIVNFPGDASLTPCSILKQVADNMSSQTEADCATLYSVEPREVADKESTVNLILDNNGYVIYCSRTAIPHQFSDDIDIVGYKCHNGINAYSAGLLRIYRNFPSSELDRAEGIDELKLLYNGMKIYATEADALIGSRIITENDIETVRAQIAPTR